jgi:hypothetical protein
VETRIRGTVLAMLVAVLLIIVTPSAIAEGGSLIANLSPAKAPVDVGIIFNANDLLLGLEGYQGGIGAKVGWGKVSIRGLFDFTVNQSDKAFGVNLGVAGEYHLVPGPISPYVGASLGGGYVTQSSVSTAVSFSLGAIAGVEVFIADFLSVFAEYTLAANFTHTTDLQTSQSTSDYLISTGMGNNAKLGIVIYILRSEAKGK